MIQAYTAETIRKVEEPIVSAPEYDGYLMQAAATRLAQECARLVEHSATPRILLLIGSGNNGADTLYAGARLANNGCQVQALAVADSWNHDAATALQDAGGELIPRLPENLDDIDLIIDGILGTGARGALRGKAQEIAAYLSEQQEGRGEDFPQVVACDMPSGIDSSTGHIHPPVLRAHTTVSFIGRKVAFLTPAANYCGTIVVDPLGLEKELATESPALSRLDKADRAELYPAPTFTDHKYTRGVVGIICGSEDYPGAALMSTRAAVNTGCGMVRFVGTSMLNLQVQLHSPEVVCTTEDPEQLRVQVWAAGSGATGDARQRALDFTLHTATPAVLDAAAIEPAARWIGMNGPLPPGKILTPHAGELQTFLQWLSALDTKRWEEYGLEEAPTREEIEKEQLTWVQHAAKLSGAVVLLKGPVTLIAAPDGYTLSVPGETPWLATAGSGDTLTGILGAILAQAYGAQERSQNPGDLRIDTHSQVQLAALAVSIHQQAALDIHGHEKQGPVPPSVVAERIAETISDVLDPGAR